MSDSKFKLDENAPTVSWADPKNVESSAASQVVHSQPGFTFFFFLFLIFLDCVSCLNEF